MKDYCSGWPEVWRSKIISDCCKAHDNDCGQEGDWKFLAQQKRFHKCLLSKGLSKKWAIIITIGGSIGCVLKYPYLAYTKIKFKYFKG